MHIQTAKGRDFQHSRRENLSEGGDNDQIRGQHAQPFERVRLFRRARRVILPQALRLYHGQALSQGERFDRPATSFFPRPARRSGWVTTPAQLPTCLRSQPMQGGQRGQGEVGRTHEDDADRFCDFRLGNC